MNEKKSASNLGIIVALIYSLIHIFVFTYTEAYADKLSAMVYGINSKFIDAESALFTISCTAIVIYMLLLLLKFITRKLSKSKIELTYITLLVLLMAEIFGAWVLNQYDFGSTLVAVFACTNLFLISYFCITLLFTKICEIIKVKRDMKWLTCVPFLIALTLGSILNIGIYFVFRDAILGR